MTDTNKLNDKELETVSGGDNKNIDWSGWASSKETRQAYWAKVKPFAIKYNLDFNFAEYELARAIWLYKIPDDHIEAFILAHCVYNDDFH